MNGQGEVVALAFAACVLSTTACSAKRPDHVDSPAMAPPAASSPAASPTAVASGTDSSSEQTVERLTPAEAAFFRPWAETTVGEQCGKADSYFRRCFRGVIEEECTKEYMAAYLRCAEQNAAEARRLLDGERDFDAGILVLDCTRRDVDSTYGARRSTDAACVQMRQQLRNPDER